MIVKIIACSKDTYWYKQYVGKVFNDVNASLEKDWEYEFVNGDKIAWGDAIEIVADTPNPTNKYNRCIFGLDGNSTTIDVYRVLVAFNIVDPELQHALKKLLCLGIRGKGNYDQDLDEAILSLNKLKERKEQWRD